MRLRASNVAVHTMTEIDRYGMEHVMRSAIERVRGAPFVHVSLDLDVVDPQWAPGCGDAGAGRHLVPRGAPRSRAAERGRGSSGSLQIVEVNPILDRENATGELAVRAGLLGARAAHSLEPADGLGRERRGLLASSSCPWPPQLAESLAQHLLGTVVGRLVEARADRGPPAGTPAAT